MLLVQLGHITRRRRERHAAHAAAGRPARHGRERQARRACASRCRRSAEAPGRRVGEHDARAGWPARAAAGPSWSRPTRRRCRAPRLSRTSRRCRCCWSLAARLREELADRRSWRSRATRRSSSLDAKNPDAVGGARAALHRDRALRRPARPIYDKKLELAKTKAEEKEIRFKLRRRSTRRRSSSRTRRSSSIRRSSTRIRSSCRRCGARSHLPAARSLEGAGGDDPAELELSTDIAAIAELKFRLGAVQEQHLDDGDGRGRRRIARRWSSTRRTSARAAALQAYLSTATASCSARRSRSWSRSTSRTDLAAPDRGAAHQLAHEKKPTSA